MCGGGGGGVLPSAALTTPYMYLELRSALETLKSKSITGVEM